MNIDSSNLFSMLSSTEGLDALQQEISADSTLSAEFSDALMAKINQLKGLSSAENEVENLTFNGLGNVKKLHEFADLINNKNIEADFFGKGLPQWKKLEEDIDLENTLDALTNVLNTLEQGGQEDLEAQLAALTERAESIKTVVAPDQVELNQKLDQIVEDLDILKESVSTAQPMTEEQQGKYIDSIVTNLQQLMEQVKESELPNGIDISSSDELKSQIHQLSIELDSIKAQVFKNAEEQLSRLQQNPDDVIEVLDDETDIANQVAALVASLTETKVPENVVPISVDKEVKAQPNKDKLLLKQLVAERSTGITTKAEPEPLLQKNNELTKPQPSEINPVLMAKPNGKLNVADVKEVEISSERVLPKFATDIANLNRAMPAERKVDVSPMVKHFAHPEWNKEISEKVLWMHKQAIPSAELRLNPGHLGPVTIKIDVTQDQATVAFTAQHAAVKEAIDAALPKLREMFSAQQLNLAEVSVSQEDAGQKQPRGFGQMGSNAGKGEKDANEMADNEHAESAMDIVDEIEAGRAIASNGLLSIFA